MGERRKVLKALSLAEQQGEYFIDIGLSFV